MPLITLYKGSSGLNTVLDPKSINSNAEENLIEFSQAVNISIDDRGLVTLRNGSILIKSGEYHSIFCNNGNCFIIEERVNDAAIVRLNGDGTTTGIRSSLAKGLRMAWCQSGEDTFYSNGMQNGFIRAEVSNEWPVNTNSNPDDDRQFLTEIPKASHIAIRQHGQILLAFDNIILANDFPFMYGLFCLRSGVIAAFESNVTMLISVDDGFYVSDGKNIWFFRQMEGWYNYKQELIENAPALVGSVAIDRIRLTDAGIDSPGYGAVWASTKGICIGTDNGQANNLTEAKIMYPDGYTLGACLIKNHTVIHTAQ